MDNSRLNKLPGELRNRIYRAVLVQDSNIELNGADVRSFFHSRSQRGVSDALALLFTCKQIRDEALPIFFAENSFPIHSSVHKLHESFEKDILHSLFTTRMIIGGWILSLGSSARHIRRVKFDIGSWSTHWRRWQAMIGSEIETPARVMKDLCILFVGTAAKPEFQQLCCWLDRSYPPANLFDYPEALLTFSDGKTLRNAVTEAFKDEQMLIEANTSEPGESSYGEITGELRQADIWRTRETLELVAIKLKKMLGS